MKVKHIRFLSIFLILILMILEILSSACSTSSNDYTKYISVSNERIDKVYVRGTAEWKSCYYADIYNKTENSIKVGLLLNQYSMLGGGYVGNLPCEYVFAPKERKTISRLIPNSGVTVEAEWKVIIE